MDKHKLISIVTELTKELGRVPTKSEFVAHVKGGPYWIKKHFNERYKELLIAAGLEEKKVNVEKLLKLEKKYQSLCSKKEQIQGFFRHVIDLDDLFLRAGNPKTLKVIFQPDTHTKYRDIPAVKCFIKFLNYYAAHVHIIGGDFVDCEGISHWPNDSLEPRRLIPEIKEARTLLKEIVDSTPTISTRIFLKGNHEYWIEQALTKMPELFEGLADLGLEINLEKLLNLKGFGYELFELNHLVAIGHANFTHGIYTGSNHAKKHLDMFKANMFYVHLHDTQCHNQTSVNGPMVAQSFGCLCRLDAKFLKGRPNNWEHAFGIFEFFKDGTFTYMIPRIINGKMSFNGEIFDGNI